MADAEDDVSQKDGEEIVQIISSPEFSEVKTDTESISDDHHNNEESVNVDRTALESILNVSSRLQNLVHRNKMSMSLMNFHHHSYKDKQVNKNE